VHHKLIRIKKKEERVFKYLKEEKFCFKRELYVPFISLADTDSKFAKIDGVFDYPARNLSIMLEVDERQHESGAANSVNRGNAVARDSKRMNNVTRVIRAGGNEAHLLWVRFNPDAYRVDDVLKRTPWANRAAALTHLINTFEPKPGQTMSIRYMYYNTLNGMPVICSDVEYDETFLPIVLCVF